MNYRKITEEYYLKWLGLEGQLLSISDVTFAYSAERNSVQQGYSQQFDVYCFHQRDKTIITYGDKAANKIETLVNKIKVSPSVEALKTALVEVFGAIPSHNIKFVFEDLHIQEKTARALTQNDYFYYLAFFKKNNPECKNTDWVLGYFDEMVTSKICVGVFNNNILVSCTDAPGMPYMQSEVQEIGINTLPEYRGNSYAAAACTLCAKNIIISGKCPQWSTDINNLASEKLAYKIGFARFSDVLTITLPAVN